MKLNIEPVKQRQKNFANIKLGEGSETIYDSGCLLVSLQMLLNFLFEKNYSPPSLNTELKNKGCFKTNQSLLVLSKVANAYDLEYSKVLTGDLVSVVKASLDRGVPIILDVVLSGHQHFVLAVGYDVNLLVNDPWWGETHWHQINYSKIISLRILRKKTDKPSETLCKCLDMVSKLNSENQKITQENRELLNTLGRWQSKLSTANDSLRVISEELNKIIS